MPMNPEELSQNNLILRYNNIDSTVYYYDDNNVKSIQF